MDLVEQRLDDLRNLDIRLLLPFGKKKGGVRKGTSNDITAQSLMPCAFCAHSSRPTHHRGKHKSLMTCAISGTHPPPSRGKRSRDFVKVRKSAWQDSAAPDDLHALGTFPKSLGQHKRLMTCANWALALGDLSIWRSPPSPPQRRGKLRPCRIHNVPTRGCACFAASPRLPAGKPMGCLALRLVPRLAALWKMLLKVWGEPKHKAQATFCP